MRLIAVITVSMTVLAAQTSSTNTVTAVRHWSLSDVTRVAVEVSGEFEFNTERLHNPERVYFDIKDAKPRIDSKRAYAEDVQDKMVKRIRVAETKPGVTRVVLDLASAVEASASQLSNPNRLIIELRAGVGAAIPTTLEAPTISTAPAPSAMPSMGIKPEPPKPAPKIESPIQAKPDRAPMKFDAIVAPAPVAPELPPPPVISSVPVYARPTSSGETSLVRALGLKLGRVVIDAGHGGHDQGCAGAHGLQEKELVLDVAKRVGKLIEDRLGAEVIYTRSDDTFIPLDRRTAIANEKKADLFLSIHANSSPITKISGVETYYLNFANSKDAMDVAARENASSQKSIFELRDIIQKITLHDKLEESKEFAGRIQSSMYNFSAKNFPGTLNRGVKRATFVVLIGAQMPSVLAEIGFLSNLHEEQLLKRSDYRQKLAEALFKGLSRYTDGLSHFQVATAQE